MKKMIPAIPIAIMFGILVFLFIFMCLPQAQGGSDAVFSFSPYFFRTRLLNAAVLGSILMSAFYHLTLYIFRRRGTEYLLFTIFCLFGAVYFSLMYGGLNDFFGWIPPGSFLIRFRGIISFFYHNSITVLGLYVLSRKFLLSHRTMLAAYIVLGVACYLLMPVDGSFYGGASILFILAVSLFVTVIGVKSPVLKENRWTWLYFISFILHLCSGITNMLIFPGVFYMLGLVSNLFMVLSQSVLLSKNYTDAFRFAEETNTNLECIVDERTKDLQNTNNAMKELVSNISHDLKTPLAVMSVNLEELSNLSQTLSDENYIRCVRMAYHKNLDLQRLIQNLMEISRIETEQSILRLDWVSLSDLFSKAQDKYDDYLNSKNIFFEIYYTANAEIYTDPQRIWSVLDNTIYNAARYTSEGGAITINATVHDKTVEITVSDTGCGIAAEHLPHIFERFYKVSASRSANDGDSGLGLYIVRSIMEATGGSVTAKSELDKGTSIILNFTKKTN